MEREVVRMEEVESVLMMVRSECRSGMLVMEE